MQDSTGEVILGDGGCFVIWGGSGEGETQRRTGMHLLSASPCGTDGLRAAGREHTCL